MDKRSRQDLILDRVMRNGDVSVDALAGEWSVSVMTIRRDLADLSRRGRLSRRHGGAVPSRGGIVEFEFQTRREQCAAEKQAIARAVVERIQPGMAVGLDTGTTTLEVARALPVDFKLTVLTTSLAVAAALYAREDVEVVLLGGNVRKNSPDLTGPLTESNIRQFRMHRVVLGADAIQPDGIYTTDVRIARLTRALTANADEVILAADHRKFDTTAFVKCVEWTAVHTVVTDDRCPPKARAWLKDRKINVQYVSVRPGGSRHA